MSQGSSDDSEMNKQEEHKAALAIILKEIRKGRWTNNSSLQNLERSCLRVKKSVVQLNARTSSAEKRNSNAADPFQALTGIKKNITKIKAKMYTS